MSWEIVVGIETHAQLLTRSKIFSGAATAFGAPPNTQAAAVDIALPGVLPVVNRAAVEHAIRFGLAVNGTINRRSIFARKNYFYPDLPKGYQISQYETPIVQGGTVEIMTRQGLKSIGITRAHLEEDAGKSIHGEAMSGHGVVGHMVVGKSGASSTGIDLNRAGVPLLEIVSEPELIGAEEAVTYARTLHALVRWIGICDGNMQEGSFRCDANVSVRRLDDKRLGTRCEIKNLNSFRFMEHAIRYEAERQIELLEDGRNVVQETRLYDSERNETRSMRTKEDAQDYRYFPDPDLLPLVISDELLANAKTGLAKTGTPATQKLVYSLQYGAELTAHDLAGLTQSRETAEYFNELMSELKRMGHGSSAKIAANLILGEMAAKLNEAGISISESPVKPPALAGLISHIAKSEIPISTAKKVFPKLWENSGKTVGELGPELQNAPATPIAPDLVRIFFELPPDTAAGSLSATSTATVTIANLWQISDSDQIDKVVDEVLRSNPKQVEDYRAGKEKAFNSLVGQVMKASQGKANPAQVNEILRKKLGR